MTRGFITIATGKEHYYEIAANLVKSYRFFAKNPLPFAIIAEEENTHTALFDDVIITRESTHSFMDKLLLLKLCPYDETIFLDADILAYGDLNVYWSIFENATDFSALGENVPLFQKEGVWYNVEDIGEYADKISYKTRIHAGVCFIRKSEKLTKLYDDCMDVFRNFDKLHFHTCPHSVDECVLGIAMPMNQMKAVPEKSEMIGCYPCLLSLKADILHGILNYSTPWGGYTSKGLMLHWGTVQTYRPLYRFNVKCMEYMLSKAYNKHSVMDSIKYEYKLELLLLTIPYYIRTWISWMKRIWKKVTRRFIHK